MQVTRHYVKTTEGRKAKYVTVTTPSVSFRELRRPKRRFGGGMFVEVEHAGWDKSTVSYFLGEVSGAINGFGRKATRNWLTFRLLDANKHVREVIQEDAARLAEFDEGIAALEEQLAEARRERNAFMETVWKHGRKVSISELEAPAKAKLEAHPKH